MKSETKAHKSHESEEMIMVDLISPTQKYANEDVVKHVLIIYASGSVGANLDLEIMKNSLKENFMRNFYLCDMTKSLQQYPNEEKLLSPPQENGMHIAYEFKEFEIINTSLNIQLDTIYKIAETIYENYHDFDSFIVLTGLDTICFVSSAISFMLQNLSKLVIFTGGYLPLKKMRNDSVMNIIESFAVVSEASFLNEVIIVIKNNGFRANRCVKEKEGEFASISSPNLEALCSIKIKLRLRSYLFQKKPTKQFTIFKDMCPKVKILKYQIYESIESLEYQLMNPHIKGIIIESFSSANLPQNEEILNVFKKAHESTGVIFVNIPQSIKSKNSSVMQKYLEEFNIFYGGNMTCEAALAKLSYLLGKGYSAQEIKSLVQTNMRGQLTEVKNQNQYTVENVSLMKIVENVLENHYPSTGREKFQRKLEGRISSYITPTFTPQQFKNVFEDQNIQTHLQKKEQEQKYLKIINQNRLLHCAVSSQNRNLVHYFLQIGAEVNTLDDEECSPLFYALKQGDKYLIQTLARLTARVICPLEDLLSIFINSLNKDDLDFFVLLYHMEFKKTLKDIVNDEGRNLGHLSCLLGAKKCQKFLKDKFQVNFKAVDLYGFTAEKYVDRSSNRKKNE